MTDCVVLAISGAAINSKHYVADVHAVDVLVCSPSETENVSTQGHIEIEIATTARMLRKNKISVDTICPPLASSETLVDYCKERGVAFMVCPRNGFFR